MGVGPVPAVTKAMAKANLVIDDIDLIEANEAFAAQSLAVAKELKFDMNKVNVNGGALHWDTRSVHQGARILVTLLYEMQKREEAKKGLATLCIGGGQGQALIVEKLKSCLCIYPLQNTRQSVRTDWPGYLLCVASDLAVQIRL